MAPKKLDWRKINPEKHFRFAPPKQMGHGGFSVRVEVFDEDSGRCSPLIIQAPPLSLPFGLEEKTLQNGVRTFKAPLNFPTVRMDPVKGTFFGDEETLKFMQFIQAVDKCNKNQAYEQCKTWFKKEKSREIIEDNYNDNLYIGDKVRTGEYSPIFSPKIPYYADKDSFKTKFYSLDICDKDDAEFSTSEGLHYQTNTASFGDFPTSVRKCIPLLETTGLWFGNNSFGMSFRLIQIMMFTENNKFDGCAITPETFFTHGEISRPLKITLDEETITGNKKRSSHDAGLGDTQPPAVVPTFVGA
jgi:hypothetical protein